MALRRPKGLTTKSKEFDHKEFSEIIKIMGQVAEHTISQIPLLIFDRKKTLIARNSTTQIEANFDHGIDYIAISIDKIIEMFNFINSETRLIQEENKIGIKSGNFSSFLPALNQETKIEITERTNQWNYLPEDFLNALEQCFISVSKVSTMKWILNCVHVDKNKMFSSDQSRASMYSFETSLKTGDNGLIISPELAKLLYATKPKKYYVGQRFVEFANDKFYIKSALPTDDFPELVNEIFQAENQIIINRTEFLNAVEKTKLFSSANFNANKDGCLNLNFQGNILKISSQNSFGSAKERILIQSNNFREEKNINPFFILDILKMIKDENLVFHVGENRLVFENNNLKHVIAILE